MRTGRGEPVRHGISEVPRRIPPAAWASTYEKTASAARGFLTSGATRWLLDEDESVFAAFEVTYQPVAVFVVNGVEVNRWFGSVPEQELRQAFADAVA